MGREYERLFGALPIATAPAYLCERVFGAIDRERVRVSRTRLVFSSCTGLLSLLGVIVAGRALMSALASSGFDAYASLLISDSDAVMTTGHAFAFSLLESLPTPEVIVTLALLAVLIQSLRVIVASGIDYWFAGENRFAAAA